MTLNSPKKFLARVGDKQRLFFPNDVLADLDLQPGDELEVSIRKSLRQLLNAKGITENFLRETATMQGVVEDAALQFLSVKGSLEERMKRKRLIKRFCRLSFSDSAEGVANSLENFTPAPWKRIVS